MVRVRLLGPVDVRVDAVSRPVHGLRRKALLAALALQPGQAVSVDQLVDVVWGDGPPASAARTLQSHVSHLRRVLGRPTAVHARAPGYQLDLGTEDTDVQTAQGLIRAATRSTDPHDAAAQAQAAVALWRGRPLPELAGLPWFDEHVRRLDELLLQARQVLAGARLALGHHLDLIPELQGLSRQHPLHEQFHHMLMLALYRTGRQADALVVYQRLRTTLDEELGVEAGQPLRDLETAILKQDPALDPPPVAPAAARSTRAPIVPAQLPPPVAGFVGRHHELTQLDTLTTTAVVITGSPGVGKTTLATHWAHRAAHRYPDGQLHADLRGHGPDGPAKSSAEVVRDFLEALGVTPGLAPVSVDAQVGLYRSLTAGKRILVVLDNARDAAQVRPLLPGGAGCLTVITSRDPHTPLLATEGAGLLAVKLMSTAEARDLLTSRLGATRTAAEPDAVRDIITHCAHLPLALGIAAARSATHPEFPLAETARQLSHPGSTLDVLDGGDPATDVRTVFSWSYHTLDPDAARLFRLLGLHPGADISASAAASLAGVPMPHARALLAELTRANLIDEHAPGRYTFHKLLRAYATEQAHHHDSDDERRAATPRVLDHYLHTVPGPRQGQATWERVASTSSAVRPAAVG